MSFSGRHFTSAADGEGIDRLAMPAELTGKTVDEMLVFSAVTPYVEGKGEMKVTCSGPNVLYSKEGFENLGLASIIELQLDHMHLRSAFIRLEVMEKDYPAETDQYRINMHDKDVSPTIRLFDSLKGKAEPGTRHYLSFFMDGEARDYDSRLITLGRKAGWWNFYKIEVYLLAGL